MSLLQLGPAALVGDVDGDGLLRRRRVVLLRDDVVQSATVVLLRRPLLLLLLVLRHRDQHLRPWFWLGVVGLSGQCHDVGRPRALQYDGGRSGGTCIALFLRLLLLQLM